MMPASKEAEMESKKPSGQAVPIMENRVFSSMLVHQTILNDVVCYNEHDFISLPTAGLLNDSLGKGVQNSPEKAFSWSVN